MDSLDGEGWGIRGAAELVREIDRDLAEREAGYPELVRKGRMNEREADYQLAAIRDIREDLLFAFAPVPEGSCRLSDLRPAPAIAWRSKVRWIEAQLAERKERSEELIRKGRLAPNDAQRKISTIEQLRRLYWERLFMWEPEPGSQAAAYLEAIRKLSPNATERRAELFSGELGRAYRQTVREHLAALDAEQGSAQGELAA
jgi:hypothetical protein